MSGESSDNTGGMGGLTFSPLISSSIASSAGGLHFDLPLATIQSFSNQALAFTASTNNQNQGFLASIFARGSNLVAKAGTQSANTNAAAISAGYGVANLNAGLAAQIASLTAQTANYNIAAQTALAAVQSNNAAKTALASTQATVTTTTSTNKKNTIIGGIKSILSGGLF